MIRWRKALAVILTAAMVAGPALSVCAAEDTSSDTFVETLPEQGAATEEVAEEEPAAETEEAAVEEEKETEEVIEEAAAATVEETAEEVTEEEIVEETVEPVVTERTEDLGKIIKYVPYSFMDRFGKDSLPEGAAVEYEVAEFDIPGMEFLTDNAELYGVPTKEGTYTFKVTQTISENDVVTETVITTVTVVVAENEDGEVFETSDEDYPISPEVLINTPEKKPDSGFVGEQRDTYYFVLTTVKYDELFVSEGEFDTFVNAWLNGELLEDGVDYTKEEGSTRLTLKAQTLADKAHQGKNTIAMEFHEEGKRGTNLKRTAQNFYIDLEAEDEDDDEDVEVLPTATPAPEATVAPTTAPEAPTVAPTTAPQNTEPAPFTPAQQTVKAETTTVVAHLVDAEDKPLEGYTVELRTAGTGYTTDKTGTTAFKNVVFGKNTINVKNAEGAIVASKNFDIIKGSPISMDGDRIYVQPDEAFTMTLVLNGSSLVIKDVQKATEVPQTGDSSNIVLWMILLAGSMAAAAGAGLKRRKTNR